MEMESVPISTVKGISFEFTIALKSMQPYHYWMFYFTEGMNGIVVVAFVRWNKKNLLIKFPTQNETTQMKTLLHSIRIQIGTHIEYQSDT